MVGGNAPLHIFYHDFGLHVCVQEKIEFYKVRISDCTQLLAKLVVSDALDILKTLSLIHI